MARRGLALGIVVSGIGLGNLFGIPALARIIADHGWATAYFVMGIVTATVMYAGAFLLRSSPEKMGYRPYGLEAPPGEPGAYPTDKTGHGSPRSSVTLREAVRSKTLWVLFGIFFLFSLCSHMVLVHLVNYATDLGISALVAATLVSGIGLSNIAGRILMGSASDRIGNIKTLIAASLGVAVSLTWLLFARELWMLYIFTILYGFSHGAEVPQQTALTSKFFGLRVVLIGLAHCGASLGAALGAWIGGRVFDTTGSYHAAFLIGIAAIILALVGTLIVGRQKSAIA